MKDHREPVRQPVRLVRRCLLGVVVAVTTLLLALVGAVTAVAGPRGVCPFCPVEARVEEGRDREESCRSRVRAHWARVTGWSGSAPRHLARTAGGGTEWDGAPRWRPNLLPAHLARGDPRFACADCPPWICSDWIPPARWSYRSPGALWRRHLCPTRTGGTLPALVCS